uniref:Mitochondria localized glutamic acid-rich protein n=1 Tax=Xenopus tropicalis TaxID=8364 RepID=F7AKX3_XENTR
MYLCRAAWQKLAPVARNSGTAALLRNAPARQMSSSSVPGSSGSSLPYTIFVCASLTAGGLYVYHTLTRDQARFQDRHEYIRSRPKPETAAKPWPPQVSEQNTGTMAAASAEESSPVLEETSGNIQEELAAAAADDWSELSSHKPEEAGEEAVQATTESLEVAQTEEVSASS